MSRPESSPKITPLRLWGSLCLGLGFAGYLGSKIGTLWGWSPGKYGVWVGFGAMILGVILLSVDLARKEKENPPPHTD